VSGKAGIGNVVAGGVQKVSAGATCETPSPPELWRFVACRPAFEIRTVFVREREKRCSRHRCSAELTNTDTTMVSKKNTDL